VWSAENPGQSAPDPHQVKLPMAAPANAAQMQQNSADGVLSQFQLQVVIFVHIAS
jgi:hypothetical protein